MTHEGRIYLCASKPLSWLLALGADYRLNTRPGKRRVPVGPDRQRQRKAIPYAGVRYGSPEAYKLLSWRPLLAVNHRRSGHEQVTGPSPRLQTRSASSLNLPRSAPKNKDMLGALSIRFVRHPIPGPAYLRSNSPGTPPLRQRGRWRGGVAFGHGCIRICTSR